MKKTRNIGISLGILVLVSFLAILFGVPIINNITAANVKNELLALPLPDNTELIDSVSSRKTGWQRKRDAVFRSNFNQN